MKDLKNVLLGVLVIATTVLLIFYLLSLNKSTEVSFWESEKIRNEMLEHQENLLSINFEMEYGMLGVKAPDVLCDDTKLSQLVSKSPILIYRYADINCNTCYEAQIEIIQKEFKDEYEKVAILCSYQEERHFSIFKKMNHIEAPIYRIDYDAFTWAVQDYENPYYFVLYPDMSISNVFMPDRTLPKLTQIYLKGIKQLLNNSDN